MIRFLKNQKVFTFLFLGFLVLTPSLAFAGFLEETLWKAVVGIFGTILGLCGLLLNYGINEFVIGFADNYTTTGIGLAIDEVWVLIRDVMNLAFIFGLVYIGFKIILDSDDSRTRSMLANLVIAALLVNFSLFITKFTVDIANSFAAEIAVNGFYGKDVPIPYAGAVPDGAPTTRYEVDMAGDLMNRMGINSTFGSGAEPPAGEWGYIFGTALLFIITSFVFAAGGLLLTIRFVALNLYMVMSPFMFIGWAFPPLAKYTTQYWKGFLGRAFFAPIYFLFMYFSLHVLSGLATSRSLASAENGFRNSFGGTVGSSADITSRVLAANSMVPFFIVACAFMLASIVVANKMGAQGASQAISIGQNLRRKAQNGLKRGTGALTFGVGARVGQKTVGAAADRALKSSRFQNYAADTKLGEYMYRGAQKTANASFDGRKVGGMGKSLGLGAGMKGGYQDRQKESEKKATDFHDSLEADMSTTQNKKRVQAEQDKIAKERMVIESKDTFALQTDETLDTDIKGLDAEIVTLNETLKQNLKDGLLTGGERAERETKIEEKTNARDQRQAVLDDRLSIESLQKQVLATDEKAMTTSNPKLATEYRQKAENLNRELQAKKNYTARDEVLKDKEKNGKGEYDGGKTYSEDVIKKGSQSAYMRGLANEADGFNFLFNQFSAEKLAAIEKKTGVKGAVKSDSKILQEIKRTMGPNANSQVYGKTLKEAFAQALEDNRLKTAKYSAIKARKNKAGKDKLRDLSDILNENKAPAESPESDSE